MILWCYLYNPYTCTSTLIIGFWKRAPSLGNFTKVDVAFFHEYWVYQGPPGAVHTQNGDKTRNGVKKIIWIVPLIYNNRNGDIRSSLVLLQENPFLCVDYISCPTVLESRSQPHHGFDIASSPTLQAVCVSLLNIDVLGKFFWRKNRRSVKRGGGGFGFD